MLPKPTTRVHDVRCQGCGGLSGKHTDPKCPFLGAALERAVPRPRKGVK